MMRIAIVTGASSGLGRAYVQEIDKTLSVDQLWLIARREDRLRELSGSLRHDSRVVPLDLTRRESLEALDALLQAERPQVEVLVCAAGFGKYGGAGDMSQAETRDMIALNCWALAETTRICLPWLEKGSRVLEIASCAAFQPLPGMNLYAATKAFVLHYTRALRTELAQRGVKVTAVCPYWVRTEFFQVARDTANPGAVNHAFFPMRPQALAAWSLSLNALNCPVVTGGPVPAALRLARKLLPTQALMAGWDVVRRL